LSKNQGDLLRKPIKKTNKSHLVSKPRLTHEISRRKGGRRKTLNADKRQLVSALYEQKKLPVIKICEMRGISKPTFYKYIREQQAKTGTA
jgi:predicted transcriptional regulator YheO